MLFIFVLQQYLEPLWAKLGCPHMEIWTAVLFSFLDPFNGVVFLFFSFCACDRDHGGFDCSVELVSHRGKYYGEAKFRDIFACSPHTFFFCI